MADASQGQMDNGKTMRRVKVLQVITSLRTGGAEHLVVQLAERLALIGMQCDICVFCGDDSPFMREVASFNAMRQAGREDGIRIIRIGRGVYNPLHILRLARLMRHYDLVHTHNSSPQLFVAVAKVLCSVAHGTVPALCTTEHTTSNRKRRWKWYAPIESWMYSRYGHVICISQVAEGKLREYMGGRWLEESSECYGRITTINNGVDVEAFRWAQPARDLLLLKQHRKAVVMVAGFREAKDQDTLVRAMARLEKDRFEIWLVGVGDRQEHVRRLSRRYGVEGRVRFLGLRVDVPQVLRAADIVVMSSHWEGLSLSNVEGMAAGRPFLASRVDGLRQVTEGYGMLFHHEDDRQLASLIESLTEDDALYHRVAERCYSRARQFDIGQMVEGYAKVYAGLVAPMQ